MALASTACSDDARPAAAPTTSSATTEAPTEDTSVQDFLDEAGVPAALVTDLGRVAGSTGYGLSRGVPLAGADARSFAVVQVRTCRDMASGFRSRTEFESADVANGAGAADARALYDYLTATFCPAVDSQPSPSPAAAPTTAQDDAAGTRGLLSTDAQLSALYGPGATSECAAATGQPSGRAYAYLLPSGQLLCGDMFDGGPWDGHFIHVDVVFSSPVPEEEALAAVASILPADITAPTALAGVNPPYSPPGSCQSVAWQSTTAGSVVTRINPGWSNPDRVSAVLYSDRQTVDGSASAYDGTVRVATVGIGGHNTNSIDDDITC
ncbi:hypothetical protein [Klenkia soli]|uniref:hypothetical protein n=1 Tax=Klenkia soli TaxID=1052260 RepID=UPI00104238E0|nr:hypothetical protein [Klenkia soli]